MTDQWQFRLGT